MLRVIELVRKEFRQLRRDRQMLPFLLGVPVVQLILFGFAVSTDVKHLRVAVCDLDRTAESRDLARAVAASEHFNIVGTFDRHGDAGGWLDEGRAAIVMVLPRGLARDLRAGRTAHVQVLLDGSDANTGTVAMAYLSRFFAARAEAIVVERALRTSAPRRARPGVVVQTRVWYNPMLLSALFMVPGAMCVIVGMSATVATALAIVREREIGTIEQLIVTPLRPMELMLGKTLPYLVTGFANLAAILTANAVLFHAPLRGSLPFLVAVSAVFLVCSLAVGLLISTVSRTQQQAMLTAFFFLMPNFLLSGFMFPIENMPPVLQWITYLLPLRYFLVIVRAVFLKGTGPLELASHLWPLALLTVGIMALAVTRFRKRLD